MRGCRLDVTAAPCAPLCVSVQLFLKSFLLAHRAVSSQAIYPDMSGRQAGVGCTLPAENGLVHAGGELLSLTPRIAHHLRPRLLCLSSQHTPAVERVGGWGRRDGSSGRLSSASRAGCPAVRAVDGMASVQHTTAATHSMPMRSTALRSIIAARRGAAAQPRWQSAQAAAQQPPGCVCAHITNKPAVVYRSCALGAHLLVRLGAGRALGGGHHRVA